MATIESTEKTADEMLKNKNGTKHNNNRKRNSMECFLFRKRILIKLVANPTIHQKKNSLNEG